MIIKSPKKCFYCKAFHGIELPQGISEERFNKDLNSISQGSLIQETMPYLNADQRELLLSGYCTKGWNFFFPEEERE